MKKSGPLTRSMQVSDTLARALEVGQKRAQSKIPEEADAKKRNKPKDGATLCEGSETPKPQVRRPNETSTRMSSGRLFAKLRKAVAATMSALEVAMKTTVAVQEQVRAFPRPKPRRKSLRRIVSLRGSSQINPPTPV